MRSVFEIIMNPISLTWAPDICELAFIYVYLRDLPSCNPVIMNHINELMKAHNVRVIVIRTISNINVQRFN